MGIIPHVDVDLPSEDSESLRGKRVRGEGKCLVGVVRFPRIANFTDLDPLFLEDVSVVFIERPEDMDGLDAIILPGTKNTIDDLQWMKDSGIADRLREYWKKVPILGICGGYQMMGRIIDDSKGIEGGVPRVVEGLGFFDNTCTFDEYQKKVVQNDAEMLIGDGGCVTGYELHMGVSETNEDPLFSIARIGSDPEKEGSCRIEELTYGTYFHGVFDKPAFRRYFMSLIRHGDTVVDVSSTRDYDTVIEENLVKLAAAFKENLDMDRLEEILGVRQ